MTLRTFVRSSVVVVSVAVLSAAAAAAQSRSPEPFRKADGATKPNIQGFSVVLVVGSTQGSPNAAEGVPEAAWAIGDVLAGNFYGWLNDSHAVVAQFRLGTGKVIVSTFDIDRYGKDLFATRVVDGLIRYLASADCSPTTELQ